MDKKTGKKTKGKTVRNMSTNVAHAYQQAPWRLQTQWIGLFMLALVFGVLIAGVYLTITARSAEAGVQIQDLESQKGDLQISAAELRTELGELLAAESMKQRAAEMGFQPADPESAVYLVVPNYPGREAVLMAPPPNQEQIKPILLPAYKESLWEFLFTGTLTLIERQAGLQP